MVDDFSSNQGLLGSFASPASSSVDSLAIIGGERDLEVAGDGSSTSGAVVSSGLLECGAVGAGTCLLMYDGDDGKSTTTHQTFSSLFRGQR